MFSMLLTHDRQIDIARLKMSGIVNHSNGSCWPIYYLTVKVPELFADAPCHRGRGCVPCLSGAFCKVSSSGADMEGTPSSLRAPSLKVSPTTPLNASVANPANSIGTWQPEHARVMLAKKRQYQLHGKTRHLSSPVIRTLLGLNEQQCKLTAAATGSDELKLKIIKISGDLGT
ncbi:hypothetical protein G7Y89_g9856 [Cudoniella acicularis]|uniref:Uncharacterized protein n=1 Tax=Cudoniella acicularis TaxID=354080 RepID=A0A8H4RGK1_9HELO|nr:hypothetical protein G7Y89_g9856 [Cudoniella acicularis]